MTVVAWDGRTLAADKRASNSGLTRTVTKVFKLYRPADAEHSRPRFILVGMSGNLDLACMMVDWIRKGEDPATFPAAQREGKDAADLLLIDENRVYKIESQPIRILFEDRTYAMGSGRDFALMAMHLGHDAAKAVELASMFQSDCGNGVDSVTLE